ncbi:MAG: glutamyl-tRNA reductase [Halobacteriales archaeon]|nr:glutamyl-tRNA reductase [Halobacteriales archaeon]
MTRAFTLTGARVAHGDAPVAALEAANHDDPEARLRELAGRDDVAEAFLLQTCNRVEEYVVTRTPGSGAEALADFGGDVAEEYVVRTGHEGSLRHLLRVAAGLESQVLGEDQILGQVRRAYRAAESAGTVGPVLEAALLKAIHVGERARTETAINDGTVSLGSAAVQLAWDERGLEDATVLVVGAGEMARIVINGLATSGIGELRLVNRTPERAAALAAEQALPTRADGLDALGTHLGAADVAVSATASPEPVIRAEHIAGAGETLLIDLSQPRDVAPEVAEAEGVAVHDLDALEAVTAATHEDRREAAEAVEAIVDEEFDLLIDQYKRRRADAVIRGMYQGAERVKERELETALARLDAEEALDDAEREVVEELADALVAQLLAVPTKSLREAAAEDDWETVASAIQLFDPALLDEEPPAELLSLVAGATQSADASDG